MRTLRRIALLALALMLASAAFPGALANHPQGSGPRSLGGATVPPQPEMVTIEAEDFASTPVGALVDDAGATGGKAWRIDVYGVITTTVTIPRTGVVWLEVRAKGYHPEGLRNPHMHPVIDGEQRGEWDVNATWQIYRQSVPIRAGPHELGIDNFNNYHAPADDRTLLVDWVRLSQPTLDGVPVATDAEALVIDAPEIHAAGTGERQQSADARGGTQWLMWGVGCYAHAIAFKPGGDYEMTPRLRGNAPGGVGSHVEVYFDGQMVDEYHAGDAWMERATTLTAYEGTHMLEICYDNDYGGDEKRNLWLDDVRIAHVAGSEAPPVPDEPDHEDNLTYQPSDDTGGNGNGNEPGGPPTPGAGALLTVAAAALVAVAAGARARRHA